MNKKIVTSMLATILVATVSLAEAQQPVKVPLVGFLTGPSLSSIKPRTEAFRQGLRELGYVEGKNIAVEWRSAEGVAERLPDLAAELVRLKVDVIVAVSEPGVRAAKDATKTIPIIMMNVTDPVGTGLVASLAHPGGNITGLTGNPGTLGGKQLELLKETVSKVSRVAVLWNSANRSNALNWDNINVAAGPVGVTLLSLQVRDSGDLESAFAAIKRERANAIMVLRNPLTTSQSKPIADFAVKSRLPGIGGDEFVDAGGLMSYGANLSDLYRRAAYYVDKILKGAKPADLPVEQAMKFDLIINLKTAKQIGVTIPQSVLYRADKVIK